MDSNNAKSSILLIGMIWIVFALSIFFGWLMSLDGKIAGVGLILMAGVLLNLIKYLEQRK